MDNTELYNLKKLWDFPASLRNDIIKEISDFYIEYNRNKKPSDQIKHFDNEIAFIQLKEFIKSNSKYDEKDIPDLGWLQDFYNKRKLNSKIKKVYFESLIQSFRYFYYPENNKFGKKENRPQVLDNVLIDRQNAIRYVMSISKNQNNSLKEFIGPYKYFVGARRTNTRYDYIYENKIEIYKSGEVEVKNPFNDHTYLGYATFKGETRLQIISFDFDESHLLDGIGNLLTFNINKYGRRVELIPGLSASFDADGDPIFAQALLCVDVSLDKKNKKIREYFNTIAKNLRVYCPTTNDVEKLVNKYLRK